MTHEEVLDEVNVIYERISQHSKDYDSAWSDGNYTEALEILIDYYEVGFIEELEKIKAELENRTITKTIVEDSVGMAYCKSRHRIILEDEALEIIDNHIKELEEK